MPLLQPFPLLRIATIAVDPVARIGVSFGPSRGASITTSRDYTGFEGRKRVFDSKDMTAIRHSVLFKNVPDDILKVLLVDSSVMNIDRRQTLFIQGDAANYMYVVLEGWIKLTRITSTGEEVVVTVYSTGESFGEAAALQNGLYPVSSEAVTNSRLLAVKASTILNELKTQPDLAIAMLSCTFQHLHELVLQIEDMKSLSSVKRLAAFLIALAPVDEGSCTFALPYDKTLIAARLGMKPESLSRAFSRLRQSGVVASRNNVAIKDVQNLHFYVEEEKATG